MTNASSDTPHRLITKLVRGQPTSDGAGVKLFRIIGTQAQTEVDPFLMLDEFGSDDPKAYIAGFPDHPHRGFETITYMLDGRMRHKDSKGNEGLLGPGDVQWMTTARGLVHSEMPEQIEGLMRGFQLWLNLPAKEKMLEPQYQDIPAATVPEFDFNGAKIRLLAGLLSTVENGIARDHKGPIASPTTMPFIADVTLSAHQAIDLPIPEGHAGFVYVFEGRAQSGATVLEHRYAGLISASGALPLQALGDGHARIFVATGVPLKEPIARYGPFVMNTPQEIQQAFADYQSGRF